MFNFKLQTVLDIRKTMEEKSLSEFSERQMELSREKEQLRLIERRRDMLIETLRHIQGKNTSIDEIILNTESIKHCRNTEATQKERVAEAARQVDLQREALIDAVKKRKAMEILKANQFEQYQSDVNLREQAAIDEMSIVRHKRNKKE